jgi:hypothetical protein
MHIDTATFSIASLICDSSHAGRQTLSVWNHGHVDAGEHEEQVSMTGMRVCRAALLAALASTFIAATAKAEPKAVIELFTSQGCSSCPPADRLLGELSSDSSVITMSLPVDYWDYIGWKDTLAQPGHTKRQWAYAQVLGDRGVYTPQVIVNGSIQVVGSDRGAIEQAIEQSRAQNHAPTLPVTISVTNDQIKVATTGARLSTPGEVWLCSISRTVPVVIDRGENRGRTLTYHNVVRHWRRLGTWSGDPGTWTVPVKDVEADGVDEVAVLIQAGSADKPGSMLGAAEAALP